MRSQAKKKLLKIREEVRNQAQLWDSRSWALSMTGWSFLPRKKVTKVAAKLFFQVSSVFKTFAQASTTIHHSRGNLALPWKPCSNNKSPEGSTTRVHTNQSKQ